MKKSFKVISHAERMQNVDLHNLSSGSDHYEVTKVLSSEDYKVGDRAFRRSVMKTFDPRENYKGMKVTDFCLENLISCGAIEKLKSCTLSTTGMIDVDRMTNVMEMMDDE